MDFQCLPWLSGRPQCPDQTLVWFSLGSTWKNQGFFSFWPLPDLSSPHCSLSHGKPFIPGDYLVVPGTDTVPSPSASPLLHACETQAGGISQERGKIRIQRNMPHGDPAFGRCQSPFPPPVFPFPGPRGKVQFFCFSFQTHEGSHYLSNMKPQHSKLLVSGGK